MRERLILCLCLLLLSLPAFAKENQLPPLIRIGIPEDFSPFYFKVDDGEFRGASYEVAGAILKSLGYRIRTTQYSSMRELLSQLDKGSEDIAVNLTATEQRREVALFTSTPHLYESQDLIVRADSDLTFSGRLLMLSPYKIGTIWGWTHGPDFDSATYINRVYSNNSEQQLKALLSGEIDIAVNNRQFALDLSKKFGVSAAFRVLTPSIYTLPVTIAVSKKHPHAEELVKKIEQQVIRFRQTDEYRAILTRYGFEPEVLVGESTL